MKQSAIKGFFDHKRWKLYEWYYLLVMVCYVLTLFSRAVRPGVIAAVLMLGVAAELIVRRRVSFRCTLDYLAVAFFIYNAISGLWLIGSGMPANVFLEEFANSALPIIFYMVGKRADGDTGRFYQWFIAAVLFICGVGFVLYVIGPQFYVQYVYDWGYISDTDASTMRIRMLSVIGSTLVGFLSVAGMLASMYFVLHSGAKQGKLFFFLNLFFAFMSNQRSAMVVALLVLVYMNYLVFFVFKIMDKKYFYMECAVLAVGFAALCIIYMPAVMKVYYRLVSLPGAIAQRSDQWVSAVNNMLSFWYGNGLGANGHKALGYNHYVIADGGLVKMFCELGILGASIFIYMMLLVFTRGSKKLYGCAAELGIIAVALLQSVGSNILAFQLAAPVFWFAVGRLAAVVYEEEA